MAIGDTLAVYDANGVLDMIVHDPSDNAAACWQLAGGATIAMARSDYDNLAGPILVGGAAVHLALNKATVAQVAAKDAAVATKLQAIIDQTDAAIATAVAEAEARAALPDDEIVP